MIEFKNVSISMSGKTLIEGLNLVFEKGMHFFDQEKKYIYNFLYFKNEILTEGIFLIDGDQIVPEVNQEIYVLLFHINEEHFSFHFCLICERNERNKTIKRIKNKTNKIKKQKNEKFPVLFDFLKQERVGYILFDLNEKTNIVNKEKIDEIFRQEKDNFTFLVLNSSDETIKKSNEEEKKVSKNNINVVETKTPTDKTKKQENPPLLSNSLFTNEDWKVFGLLMLNTLLLVLVLLSTPFLFAQGQIVVAVLFLIMSIVLLFIEFPIFYSLFDFLDKESEESNEKLVRRMSLITAASIVLGSILGSLSFFLLGHFKILIDFGKMQPWYFISAASFVFVSILFIILIRPIRDFVNSIKNKK